MKPEKALQKVRDGENLEIKDPQTGKRYLTEENSVTIRIQQLEGKWIKTLYSNQVKSVNKRWIKHAQNKEKQSLKFVKETEIPKIDKTSCIAKYCQGNIKYRCRKCGEIKKNGLEFAKHTWNQHSITSDPRKYRSKATGQQKIGKQYTKGVENQ